MNRYQANRGCAGARGEGDDYVRPKPGEPIQLDGNNYTGCTFNECKMAFSGMGTLNFAACTFRECEWAFEGAAAATVSFMKAMYGANPDLIEKTFDQIRGKKR